jgi:FkbH-like protein
MWAASDVLGTHVTRLGGELLAERLERMLWALDARSRRIKCAVFDLDDTLWSGVLREDGVDGVFVRHDHLAAMANLASRGILLAVCSKNDPVEAELVAQLLGAELHEKIVSMSLDWEPKSSRLAKLAADLGIGLDTLAFFDDNPRERAEVEMNAPAVLVLPDTDIMAALTMPEFEPGPAITSEAGARSTMYRQQARRSEVEAASASPEVFLRSLDLRLDLHPPSGDELTRVAELIARTNQLNATMQRTSLAELRAAVEGGGSIVVACLSDRFGDYGLVGAAVTAVEDDSLRLVELAISCRAMGRSVEHALVAELVGQLGPGRNLVLDFVATERNGELRRILGEIGFVPSGSHDGVEALALEGGAAVAVPEWLARVHGAGGVVSAER